MTRYLLMPWSDAPEGEPQAGLPAAVRHWARQRDVRCVLLHVLPRALLRESPEEREIARRQAAEQLGRWQSALAGQGVEAGIELRIGEPAEEIAKAALLLPAFAVAMPTHGRDGVERLIQGSVAESVLRGTDTPILLWRATPAEPREGHRILLPVAEPDSVDPLLPALVDYARDTAAEVLLFHDRLAPRERGGTGEGPDTPAYIGGLRGHLEQSGIRVQTLSRQGGHIVYEILSAASRYGVGLIAMTTHARQGVERLIHGSVAEKVLRQAPCPVWLQHIEPIGRLQAMASYLG